VRDLAWGFLATPQSARKILHSAWRTAPFRMTPVLES
jgi:hypothetical protein